MHEKNTYAIAFMSLNAILLVLSSIYHARHSSKSWVQLMHYLSWCAAAALFLVHFVLIFVLGTRHPASMTMFLCVLGVVVVLRAVDRMRQAFRTKVRKVTTVEGETPIKPKLLIRTTAAKAFFVSTTLSLTSTVYTIVLYTLGISDVLTLVLMHSWCLMIQASDTIFHHLNDRVERWIVCLVSYVIGISGIMVALLGNMFASSILFSLGVIVLLAEGQYYE